MKFTDKDLEQAAKQVCLSLAASPPEADISDAAFSPELEEKMTRLMKKEHRRTLLKRVSRSAAAVLLPLLILGGVLITCNVDARAALRSWVRTVRGELYTYHFTENRKNGELPRYEITKLPEGYTLSQADYRENSHVLSYRKPKDGTRYITPLSLEYLWISEDFSPAITGDNYHELTVKTVEVNGITADLYVQGARRRELTTRTLFWVDEEAGIVFHLRSRLSEEELIAVAESIRPVK